MATWPGKKVVFLRWCVSIPGKVRPHSERAGEPLSDKRGDHGEREKCRVGPHGAQELTLQHSLNPTAWVIPKWIK